MQAGLAKIAEGRGLIEHGTLRLLPVAYCPLPVAYFPLAAGCLLLSIVYCLLFIGYWLLSVVYCLLAIGYCLLSIVYIGYWLLAIVYCSSAVHRNRNSLSLSVVVKIPNSEGRSFANSSDFQKSPLRTRRAPSARCMAEHNV
jgi:hypothetical protein